MGNKKNNKVTVIIISILIIIILVLGLTFAYLRTELSGSEQIVKVGTLDLILNETSEGISLDNAIGLSDSKGMSTTPSTFELKNNGNKAVDYIIYLDDNTIGDNDTRIDDKYLKYNLNKNGTDSGALSLTSIGSNPNRVLDSGTIEGGGTNKYSLSLWISDEVDGNYSGQVFSGKLRVEVSQEKDKSVASVFLRNLPEENINTTDSEQTFITGEDPNNYIWYSGKLWRAVSIDPSDNSVKLVTQWNISAIPYDDDSSAFEESYMQEWLNDTTVDGFLGNLREPEKFIKMDSKWNATAIENLDSISKPSKENIVTSPIGLINLYEYNVCGDNSGYLNNGLNWWTLTPYVSYGLRGVDNSGVIYGIAINVSYGIRPSINLQPNIKIAGGSGTKADPYRLVGDNDNNLSGTYLKDRYSGEYIRFGTGENNLYRIVSHETEGLTKIVSSEPLKENGKFKTIAFGDNVRYTITNGIGLFLNNDYLNPSSRYLTSEQVDMIENSTTWYLGIVSDGQSYKLAKYTNLNNTNFVSEISTKIGLLRLGELMSGQENNVQSNSYWLITLYNDSYVRQTGMYATSGTANAFDISSIKPALNLKSNVVITSGDGTKENPFEIAL